MVFDILGELCLWQPYMFHSMLYCHMVCCHKREKCFLQYFYGDHCVMHFHSSLLSLVNHYVSCYCASKIVCISKNRMHHVVYAYTDPYRDRKNDISFRMGRVSAFFNVGYIPQIIPIYLPARLFMTKIVVTCSVIS